MSAEAMMKKTGQINTDDVRATADIVDVISQHVELKKKGQTYVGLCPFHAEKTPSFVVNKTRQFFYCFGCERHGDVIRFVMDFQRIGFIEACENLAGGKLIRQDAEAMKQIREQQAERERQAQKEKEETQTERAAKARELWNMARRDIDPKHGYLVSKGIRGYGLRQLRHQLVVPVSHADGSITSLQFIKADGSKRFLTGGQVMGGYAAVGIPDKVICICEGVATRDSIREATSYATVAAFSAGNLLPVARALRAKFPALKLVLCADNDQYKQQNIGVEKARQAAEEMGCLLAIPRFQDVSTKPTDFNDLHRLEGVDRVRLAIDDALKAGPVMPFDNGGFIDTGNGPDGPEEVGWRSELIVNHKADGTQTIVCRAHNIILILSNDEHYRGRLAYNEFIEAETLDGEFIDDVAVVKIQAYLERHHIKEKVKQHEVREALKVVCASRVYHPIRDFLQALQWDGVERLPTFFSDFCSTPQDEYHDAVSRSLFVSAVSRIMKPGCKVDTMVVLESKLQGFKKSTLWAMLFHPWYSEVISSLNSKDFFECLSGVWCADFGELDQLRGVEATRFNQVITATEDNFRASYGRKNVRHQRQNIFVGTTNRDDWLHDPTGGRRFLPVRLTDKIDVDAILPIRDQLWAEGMKRYQDGETWWDIPQAKKHQFERYQGDSWSDLIGDWLIGKTEVTVTEILLEPLKIDIARHDKSAQTRVGNIMRHMNGWERKWKWVNGKSLIVYHKLESSKPL